MRSEDEIVEHVAVAVLPIWLETWELECCQPEFAIGDRWRAPLTTRDLVERSDDVSERWQPLPDGRVRIVGRVTRAAATPDQLALVSLGDVTVGIEGLLSDDYVAGTVRLYFTGHGPSDGVEPDEVVVVGVVRRLQRAPIIYRQIAHRSFEIAGYEELTDISSTTARHEHDVLVVHLEPNH